MKRLIKHLFEKVTGYKMIKRLPFGIDQFSDIKRRLSGYNPMVILDVGANTGQSAVFFAGKFPAAKIYSIEPSESTFKILKDNTQSFKNVFSFNNAIGSSSGFGNLIEGDDSSTNKVVFMAADASENISVHTVQFITLDQFCQEQKISKVDYLKIDTEGYDLEVLKSCEKLLLEKSIDFIETEVGMNPANEDHVDLHIIKTFLEEQGYHLFGLYEQVREWKYNKNYLRRCNALFISSKLI